MFRLLTRARESGYIAPILIMSATDMADRHGFMNDPVTPRWERDLFSFLPVKSQFILSNNVRDRYPFAGESGKYTPLSLTQYLAEAVCRSVISRCFLPPGDLEWKRTSVQAYPTNDCRGFCTFQAYGEACKRASKGKLKR